MWTIILGIVSKLVGYFFGTDERDKERDSGEKLGVSETQAATAQHTIQEAKDAAQTQDDVSRLSDDALDCELRDGSKGHRQ